MTQSDMRTQLNVQSLREKRTHVGAYERRALTRYRHITAGLMLPQCITFVFFDRL